MIKFVPSRFAIILYYNENSDNKVLNIFCRFKIPLDIQVLLAPPLQN